MTIHELLSIPEDEILSMPPERLAAICGPLFAQVRTIIPPKPKKVSDSDIQTARTKAQNALATLARLNK